MTHLGLRSALTASRRRMSEAGKDRGGVMEALIRAHRLLCSRFVSEEMFRAAIGAPRADINATAQYLALPPAQRRALALSPYFDVAFYRALNHDALREDEDALLHFLELGIAELRSPHPLIDLRYIVSRNPLILGETATVDGLLDLLDHDLVDPSPYFNVEFYAAQRGGARGGSLLDFLTGGAQQGRRPTEMFDPAWYHAQYDDAPADEYLAARHFIILGDGAGRAPSAGFDPAYYCKRYPDVAVSGLPPLMHYLLQGRRERREIVADEAVLAAARILPAGHALPTDAATIRDADADIRARIAAAKQARKDMARVQPAEMLQAKDPAKAAARLRFAKVERPRISVLVPAFNQFALTVECLMSLARSTAADQTQVVLADDASTDLAMARLAKTPGLTVIRHAENLGFLASCNAAFAACAGDYVLLLNNDAQIAPDAIAHLAAALDADPGLGAVGAKLLYPNGRLQEAGCYIKPNGETGMTGLFMDPKESGYCRDREVAYCSGAALMVRRAAIKGELFDPRYAPAYCEDVDLCLSLREDGWRIGYVHRAAVVHHLSVSTAAESEAKRRRLAARNQQRLAERWGETLREMDRVRVLAFFLPQFHPTPENDLWWGRGFTEWTNVARAMPSYEGHYQPHLPADLGFYDLRLAETLAAQAGLAARYGVDGFVIYHYNFGAKRMLARPLEVLREHPEIDIKFCLCWANENWTRHWDGGARELLLEQKYDDATLASVIEDAVEAARDGRAITVGGKPLFLVYRPLSLPDAPAFAAACRAAFAEAGFAGVHLAYVESMEVVTAGIAPASLGFDASVEFPPHGHAAEAQPAGEVIKPGWQGYRYDYPDTVCEFVARPSTRYVRYPTVFPSWDNTPRQPRHGTCFDRATPEAFAAYVAEKIDEIRNFLIGDERLLFVNAWNEWAEGAHLEPDAGFGHRWLEALRNTLDGMALR
jgi:O-antigen biosynthesis protein